jgi:predicted TIM-barrel fold metal-dependent hydrolase
MIDMHAHWRPAQLADALRERTREPRIVRNPDGAEVVKTRMGEEPLSSAFDDVDTYLARMDRQGVSMSVLSLLGTACWIESQRLEVSLPLCRLVNDSLSRICQQHAGRFTAHAALPLADISAAAAELDRALGLPGMVGAQLPANGFLTGKAAEKMRPCSRSRTGIALFFSYTTARCRATLSRRSLETRTTRAAATARSTCRRACRRQW